MFRTTLFFLILLCTNCLIAQEDTPSEYEQKTKMIRNLINYIEWPKGAIQNDVISVCILGQFPNLQTIRTLDGTLIHHHKIAIKEMPDFSQSAQGACQLIYIARSEETHLDAIIRQFNNQPVVLLGDMEHFAAKGGSINFTSINETLALTINLQSLKKSNLSINTGLFEKVTIIPEEKDLAD